MNKKVSSRTILALVATCFSLAMGQDQPCEPSVDITRTLPSAGGGHSLVFDFQDLPDAVSDVQVQAKFEGDFHSLSEDSSLTSMFQLSLGSDGYSLGGGDCRNSDDYTATLPASDFNNDHSSITLDTTTDVCGGSWFVDYD
mmetsp:Transcript_45405/g.109978  ORF Transcript_45405/g.109978 Transcript_45405/m.109978 type:complete len:141 (+) Transcript_45405:1479-1901(+)